LNEWIENNFDELKSICKKITRGNDYDDLFQMCLEMFLTSKKVKDIPDTQKLFFFTRIVKNNYNSTTSPYYHTHRKFKYNEIENIEVEDIKYEEPLIDIDWVKNQIDKDKKTGSWYYARLFEIYIDQGCSVTKTSQLTTIPINSVSRDINKYRKRLKEKRQNEIRN
jgi:hypothetical protein